MSDELIPQPKVTDAGNQRKPAPAEDAVGQAAKILPMDETLQGIATTNPRSLGSGVGPHLLVAAFGEQSNNVRELKDELKEVRAKLETQSDELTQCKIDKERFHERVDNMTASTNASRKLQNIIATLAAIMLSVGLKMVSTQQNDFGWVLMIFGVSLLVTSWFVGGAKKK